MKTKYAVEFFLANATYRYASTRLALSTTSGCGVSQKVAFIPWLKKADGLSVELDLSNKSAPIPSTKIEIWDPNRLFMSEIDNIDIEQLPCVFHQIIGDDVENDIVSFRGYATDLSYNGGTISLTIRATESTTPIDDINEIFSYDSFQSFEVISPKAVDIGTQFIINENTPWSLFKKEIHRSSIASQNFGSQSTSGGHLFPDVPAIRLWATSFTVPTYTPTLGDIDSTLIGGDVGAEYTLVESNTALFPDPNGAYYATAIIGHDGADSKQEVIKYSYAKIGEIYTGTPPVVTVIGDGQLYLSGIPTVSHPDPISAYATTPEKDAFADEFKVKYQHRRKEIAAPQGRFDIMWVKSNGLVPSSENDPELGVGFIDTGRVLTDLYGKEYSLFSRYQIDSIELNVYDTDINDGTEISTLLKLNIHSRPADTDHIYAASSNYVGYDIQSDLDADSKLRLASFEYIVYSMDLHLFNIGEDLYSDLNGNFGIAGLSIEDNFQDRYRGLRVDMFNDFSDFIDTLDVGASAGTQQDVNVTNDSLLNNANGKFAVCTTSKIVKVDGEVYERLFFTVPAKAISTFKYVEADADSVDDQTQLTSYDSNEESRQQLFVNYLKTSHDSKDIGDWEQGFDFFGTRAQDYFLSSRYRIIHDPVPENSDDLGKMFPICYGKLVNVPILQCISKKVFGNEVGTAGDDYYVYASHRCEVSTPADITLRLFGQQQEKNGEFKQIDAKDIGNIVASNVIQSPFPNYADGHFEFKNLKLRSVGRLMYPYAKLQTRTTLSGTKTYGIKLRGDEWDDRANHFDKRYPIRNGVGNSVVYASFRGYKDDSNKFLLHPADVLRHYLLTYGNGAYSAEAFDQLSLDRVKAQTPKYEVSIYLTEPISAEDFVAKMAEQFGLFVYNNEGKTSFVIPDLDYTDLNNPISEYLNLIEGASLSVKGYKTTYNEVLYNYAYDYPNSKYKYTVRLDKDNNKYCSQASKNRGDRKPLTVNADWVRSSIVANDVARRYARTAVGGTKTFSCSVKWIKGIDHQVGQVVPMTCEQLGLNKTPVLILSKSPESYGYSMSVLKLT